jgi:hypothetical protein
MQIKSLFAARVNFLSQNILNIYKITQNSPLNSRAIYG